MIQLNAHHIWYLVMAAQWTALLSLVAFVGGALVGLPIALMRVSPNHALRVVAAGYIQLIQGTPLLILLFLAYFGLGILGYKLAPLVAAGLALTLYAAAFLGEIWWLHRGGTAHAVGSFRLPGPRSLPAICLRGIAASRPNGHSADCGLHGTDREEHVTGFGGRLRRAHARRSNRQQLDLRALHHLLHRGRNLFCDVLPAIAGQPFPRKESQCRQRQPLAPPSCGSRA